MGLQIWLPLNGNLDNQGLSDVTITNSGATVNDSGKIGKCYSFDGSDDYISINCSDLYTIFSGGSQQFTMAFWVYHADSTRAIIFGDYGLTGAINFNLELSTDHRIRFYWAGAPDKTFASYSAITVSTWTHIAITYDGAKVRLYRNGALQADTHNAVLATRSKTSGVYYLGRDSRTGATVLNGRINDFRIYDYAISDEQVKELSRGLILHYPLSGPTEHQTFGDAIEDKATYILRRTPGYNLIYTVADKSSATYQYNNNGIKLADLTAGWHMFTLIYDLTGEKIYIDGQLHSSANFTSYGLHYNFGARLYLGCEANSANPTSPYFNGKLSDFRVYYTALSASDVAELYGSGVTV